MENEINVEEVIQYLREIESGLVPRCTAAGLCLNLKDETGFDLSRYHRSAFVYRGYEYYSGNSYYPIACPEDSHFYGEENNSIVIYEKTKNLYMGEYGRRRRLLAGEFADYFEVNGI